ncbi:hypothetical protein GCM10011386_26930 [Parapedobacter defluvii]|uniref:Uncharacterized protein n=1 Tax=Parapedobacter defluvii TaxID=2045106 RepID=A0ABQ1M1L4_9SPHI|nr:hypothetical protein GCM10011386_26930 [Parapedobacter defluvii]
MGCGPTGKDTPSSITGTYVNHAEGEYSISDDTLEVSPDGTREHTYRILRRSTFRRIAEDGTHGDPVHQREEWTAVLNPETGALRETRKRRNITVQPESGTLTVEKREYRKITTDQP